MLKPILLVEDNPRDLELTLIALERSQLANDVVIARDGAEALDYLFARGSHTGRTAADLPAVVLLDLNLPKLNGREVLQAIRSDPATRSLPVVVLTTSAEPFDVDAVYELGANSYIQKTVEFERFVDAVRQIGLYWLTLNQAPGNP